MSKKSISARKEISVHLPPNLPVQNVPGGKVNILVCHSLGHSKQNRVFVHMSYSEHLVVQHSVLRN
jgi:hypothetical protein